MKRIFLTLAVLSTLLLIAAFVVGLLVEAPQNVAARRMLSYHVLTSVAALIFATLVHAVLLTYFMGTSRWLEETQAAYGFDRQWTDENRRLKYGVIPVMAACLVLLILNIPIGALAVDAVPGTFADALARYRAHLVFAALTVVANVVVNVLEYRAIRRNGELIAEVVDEVRRMRAAAGLPV